MNNHSLTISKLINSGYGLGYLDNGQVVLVRLALPGEKVTIAVREKKKSYLVGRLVNITEENSERIAPPCPYYGACGGCDLQHCSYDKQLVLKSDILKELLERQFGGETAESLLQCLEPIHGAKSRFNYRQRIRLWVDNNTLGFRRYRSHFPIEIERCLLAREELNRVLSALRSSGECTSLLGHCSELELLWNPANDKVTALFHLTRKPRPADFGSASSLLLTIDELERIFFTGKQFSITPAAPENSSKTFTITLPGVTDERPVDLLWEIGGFCQVHTEQNLALIQTAFEFAQLSGKEKLLDLYCGMGNISIPLGHRTCSITGFEGQGSSIRSAKENARLNGLSQVLFTKSSIEKGCEKLLNEHLSFDIVIIDPPRQGISGLAQQLSRLCSNKLIYVSCDPATLCRDLKELIGQGFHVSRIKPIDMFPQTHHIETIVLLEKN